MYFHITQQVYPNGMDNNVDHTSYYARDFVFVSNYGIVDWLMDIINQYDFEKNYYWIIIVLYIR